MKLTILTYGRLPYQKALDTQFRLRTLRQKGLNQDTLMLLEHDPVITWGKRTCPEQFLEDPVSLKAQGVTFAPTDRGGQATWHGPGQIIGYVIADLSHIEMDIRLFIRGLEETLIRVLSSGYGLPAGRSTRGTGVWIRNRKIGSIGLSVNKGVTMHGFALNADCSLEAYQCFIPCGLPGSCMTSLAVETGRTVNIHLLKQQLAENFCQVFGYRCPSLEKCFAL